MKRLVCVVALAALSCGEDPPPDPPLTGNRLGAATSIAEHAILTRLVGFRDQLGDAELVIAAWERSPADPAARAEAQNTFRILMEAWQTLEPMQLGPAAAADLGIGGQDLRDRVYSWPIVNPCRVDQELTESAFEDPDALAMENVNVLGLDAMEYLVFTEGDTNACAPNAPINLDGRWAAITAEVEARRARYVRSLVTLLQRDADAIVDAWQPAFTEAVRTAGAGSALFDSAQEALNAISDALFYLDKEVKDMKVAEPAGLTMTCATPPCPELRESRYANRSLAWVHRNLIGSRALYLAEDPAGTAHTGFDALLRELGQTELADELLAAFDDAIALAERDYAERTVEDVLAESATGLMPLYDAIKRITDLLKTQFVTVLDLELPMRAEGDND